MGSAIKERRSVHNTQAPAHGQIHSRPKGGHSFTANEISGPMFLIEGLVSLVGWMIDPNLLRPTGKQN
jgi:hypothetical protein